MAPRKCVYYGCNNSSSEYSMFRFPSNDKNRLELWLANAGNMALSHLTEDELSNRYLCEAHFDPFEIKKSTGFRPVLDKTAIPKSNSNRVASCSPEHLKVKTPTKVYRGKRKLDMEKENIAPVEAEYNFQTPTKRKRRAVEESECVKKLKQTVTYCTKKLKSNMISLKKLKKKLPNKDTVNIEKFPFKSESSKTLTKMQLKTGTKKWTTEKKNLCLAWYYKSPALYKHMRRTGVVLAAPSTIKVWLKKASCFPGLSKVSFDNIKKKFEHATEQEKACVVCFDEMAIMTCLEYNEKFDLIEGFEDLGKGQRTDKLAKTALVFVARGLYTNWKIPLAYFLSNTNVKADSLKHLIKRVLQKTLDSKLLPKAVVCDQGTTNVSALKQLGVTAEQPFLMVNNKKIFSIFDVPHIIKNLRNNLLTHNFLWRGNEVCFQDIIDLYNIDKNNKSKSIKKITQAHLNPNAFQKMRVKLATQIFSHSVAAALETAASTGEIKSVTASHTAAFIEEINNLFDALNSRSLKHRNPYRRALTKKNDAVRKTLVSGITMMQDLKKVTYKKDGTKMETVPPSFTGMIQSIRAILNLFEEENKKEDKFIMTYRLNQDVIENLFGIYRMKTGCNRNPTARQLRAVFRSHLLNGLISSNTGNCEEDEDKFILEDIENPPMEDCTEELTTESTVPEFKKSSKPSQSKNQPTELINQQETETVKATTTTLEDCSIAYFAGYLGKKFSEKYDCQECKAKLLESDELSIVNDPNQMLILNKNYGIKEISLKAPSKMLYQIIKEALIIYSEVFENSKCKLNVKKNILNIFQSTIIIDITCKEHIYYILEKLINVKIHDFCKTSKRNMNQSQLKLKILQNK